MSTPTIQTLITQAQQVLNLKSSNEIRATLAAVLANANVGTPLNPNLTTQQLWDEFYEIVRQPSDDIMSIITDQMMRMVFSPPAPGGAGADKQVIFNDGGVLAGDAGLMYNKATDALTITGDLTVDTSTLKVDSTNNRVIVGHTSGSSAFQVTNAGAAGLEIQPTGFSSAPLILSYNRSGSAYTQLTLDGSTIVHALSGSTAMTLNSTGLGLGVVPSTHDAGKGLEVGALGNGLWCNNSTFNQLLQNATYNGGWKYAAAASTAASRLEMGGSFGFYIAPAGTAPNAITFGDAKMTLDASGNLLIDTTSASGRVAVDADLAVYNGMAVKNTGTTYGASSFFFRFINSSGVTAGSIQHTAVTTTNYSTTSDSRLKESKGISTDTSVIDNTIVRDFVWKADGSTDRGVFAQEAQSVKPRAISAGSDDLTEDGNIKTPWSVDYSKYVPDLIVYCQQLKKQVVELTTRVQTLEAR